MKTTYEMTIAGCKRALPICKASDDLVIAGFVIFGDVELTCACAAELLKKAPADFDYMVAPEAKAIPLIHEMARQSGRNTYCLVRKAKKLYMDGVFETKVRSITTEAVQSLYMDGKDARAIKGKKVIIVDDVISTGESLRGVEQLVTEAGAEIVGRMCILAEGDAEKKFDLTCLGHLPLFDQEGNPLD